MNARAALDLAARAIRRGSCSAHKQATDGCATCAAGEEAIAALAALITPSSAVGRDKIGVCIDHANASLDLIEAHAVRAGVSSGEMLHTVATAWVDRRADERLVSRSNPNVERLTSALANLDAQRWAREERRS